MNNIAVKFNIKIYKTFFLKPISNIVTANCRCKSTLKCSFEENYISKTVVGKCYYQRGDCKQKCGKLYLREPIRGDTCQVLQHKSVDRYRAEKALDYMLPDGREPLTLPSSNVLNVAKSKKLHISMNILSLHLLK